MAAAAEDFGGQTLSDGIRLHGWKFTTSQGPIASTSELQTLKAQLRDAVPDGPEFVPKLPEAVYLRNTLTLTHEASGKEVRFDAQAALVRWLHSSLQHGSGGMTVPAADLTSWKSSREEKSGDKSERPDWDWTYSTDYTGSTSGWVAHEGAGIDGAMLRRRDVPVLFYADLPLFHDDLHDHGASELRVRIRVMPNCFFVLLRHFLRVDGAFIRQRDARYFCKLFSADEVPTMPPSFVRLLRDGQLALPPLPSAFPDTEGAALGQVGYVDGGSADTPRPALALALPDEQTSAERLAAVPPELERTEELPI